MEISSFAGSPNRFSFFQGYYESENPSSASTPFVSAPSSPGRNGTPGFYFSAPTSPTWTSRIKARDACSTSTDLAAVTPSSWQEKLEGPMTRSETSETDERSSHSLTGSDFEFSARFLDFEEPPLSPTPMSSANELFLNGQIRPLSPPSLLQQPPSSVRQLIAGDGSSFHSSNCSTSPVLVPPSVRSPSKDDRQGIGAGSMCQISGAHPETAMAEIQKIETDGRHRRTRSFFPLKIFNRDDVPLKSSEGEGEAESSSSRNKADKDALKRSSPMSSRKWTLKGLLHRSGGDGRSQYPEGSRRWPDSSSRQSSRGSRRSESSQSSVEWENDRTRSTLDLNQISSTPNNVSALAMKSSRRSSKGSVSPHELHYTKQRAQTEELRKKTFLPYRQGLLGCLGFSSKSYGAMTSISNALQPVS